jgi:hypothetical protein
MKNNLDEKIFDIKDWVPGYGWIRLMKRAEKLSQEILNNRRVDTYTTINTTYNATIIFALVYNILK